MRISWKILLCTLVAIIVTFGTGGYILISSLFHSALEREIKSAKDENQMLFVMLNTAAASVNTNGEDEISSIVQSVSKQISSNALGIRVFIYGDDILYENSEQTNGISKLEDLEQGIRQYAVVQEEENYFIQTGYRLTFSGTELYVETFRDITSLFDERQNQFELYRRLLVALILINGLVISALSLWITRPITVLSETTRRIADGNMRDRARVRSKDEVGRLAADFNKMADNLEEKIQALEDAAQRQQNFSGSFAHEAKTPLTSIIGYADMLRSQSIPEEERMIIADKVFREGKRLESLSLKLLELIVLQKREFEMKRVEISRLIELVVTSFSSMLSDDIKIELHAQKAYVKVEPDLFQTLVLNLLDNAAKSITPPGRIIVTGKLAGRDYHIRIEDNGQGIPEQELSRITEAFYMVDKSRTRANNGVGLGLAICAEIVRLHRGELNFESRVGRGTVVHLVLKGAEKNGEQG